MKREKPIKPKYTQLLSETDFVSQVNRNKSHNINQNVIQKSESPKNMTEKKHQRQKNSRSYSLCMLRSSTAWGNRSNNPEKPKKHGKEKVCWTEATIRSNSKKLRLSANRSFADCGYKKEKLDKPKKDDTQGKHLKMQVPTRKKNSRCRC